MLFSHIQLHLAHECASTVHRLNFRLYVCDQKEFHRFYANTAWILELSGLVNLAATTRAFHRVQPRARALVPLSSL